MSGGEGRITAGLLRRLYRRGMFPMVHPDGIYVHDPDPRAIFPLEDLHPNARLRRFIRSHGYSCTMDQAFRTVMEACADRPDDTWINDELIDAYCGLRDGGHATSVEVWQEGELIGGLYGVKLGRAFFGESMFSRKPNASKAAFYHMAGYLRTHGFTLFDTQYINDHTRMLGAIEVPRAEFRRLLREALQGVDPVA